MYVQYLRMIGVFWFVPSQIFGSLLHNQAKLSCRMDRFVSILAVLSAVCSSLGLALGAIFPGDVALAAGPALMVIYVVLGSVGPAGSVDEVTRLSKIFKLR
jgi:hypothetical protein